MRPVLFEIFNAEVRSYYALWAFALFLLVVWTRRRAERLYGMSESDVSSVLVWVYCAGILGSFVPGIMERLPLYLDGRIAFAEVFRGCIRGCRFCQAGFIYRPIREKRSDTIDRQARALCERLIAENDGDVQAYTTYAAILGQTEEREKAAAVAKKLSRMYTEDTDELYKIATVCCENGLHAAALEKFIQLEKEMPNDGNLLYFKAVSAYKSGNIPLALDTFDRLLVIYPEAAVARYYYDLLRHYPDHRDKEDVVEPDLTYFYRVPQKVREAYCDMLCFLEGLHVREAEELSDNPQVISVLQWSFDELDGADGDLQMLAMSAAVHCRYERFVEETLLDPDVSDVVKVQTMQLIAEQNKETEYGVVVCHIYRHVRFYRLKINGKKKKKFLHAYAAVFAKFAVVSDNHAQRIRSSAELLYNCLALREATSYADKPENISCAIYLLADIREAGSKPAAAAELFGAEEAEVSEILELVRAVTNEVLRRGRKESPKADEESAAAYAETDAEKKDDGEE